MFNQYSIASRRAVFPAVAALVCVACGDVTSSTGELGRLRYSLSTDYDVPESQLTQATIVTHHSQRLGVQFTAKGLRDRGKTQDRFKHTVSPTDGVTLQSDPISEGHPPAFNITVLEPGTYTIETTLDDELFDRIRLKFDTPTSFYLVLKMRPPYAEHFSDVTNPDATIQCEQGTQFTVTVAPLDANQRRLAGTVETEAAIDPHWAAVPGVGVVKAYENGVWATRGQTNFYFIEPGIATLTVYDSITDASQTATFDVAPITKD